MLSDRGGGVGRHRWTGQDEPCQGNTSQSMQRHPHGFSEPSGQEWLISQIGFELAKSEMILANKELVKTEMYVCNPE